jgi:hypothetical protein
MDAAFRQQPTCVTLATSGNLRQFADYLARLPGLTPQKSVVSPAETGSTRASLELLVPSRVSLSAAVQAKLEQSSHEIEQQD